jgi:hypothetical protein
LKKTVCLSSLLALFSSLCKMTVLFHCILWYSSQDCLDIFYFVISPIFCFLFVLSVSEIQWFTFLSYILSSTFTWYAVYVIFGFLCLLFYIISFEWSE